MEVTNPEETMEDPKQDETQKTEDPKPQEVILQPHSARHVMIAMNPKE